MLRRLRRLVRTIDYHSARRERTAWTRASDVLLFASPCLAIAAAWFTHVAVARDAVPALVGGVAWQDADGRWSAVVGTVRPGLARPVAAVEFEATRIIRSNGWPLHSARSATAPTVALSSARAAGQLMPVPMRTPELESAIAAALVEGAAPRRGATARTGTGAGELHLGAFLGNVAFWWVLVLFLGAAVLQVMRLLLWFFGELRRRHAFRQRRHGRCPGCGFDLRGSVWSEHCPECGDLLR